MNDVNTERKDSFRLFQALNDDKFQEQFITFSQSTYIELPNYLLIYKFFKHRIWSIIIHQQYLEGMFNRYDLKSYSNISVDLQKARMQLSDLKTLRTLLTKEKLLEIHLKRKEEEKIVSKNSSINGEEAVTKLLEKFLKSSNKKK